MCAIPIKGDFSANVKYVVKCLFAVTNGIYSVQVKIHYHPESGINSIPPPLVGLVVTETIFALIYQHPCRSVLDQDAATGELPLCVHRFAATQTSSSLRKIQV